MHVWELTRTRLGNWLTERNLATAHVKPLLQMIYGLGPEAARAATQLPDRVRTAWSELDQIAPVRIAAEAHSRDDGSVKFVMQLNDELEIETVLMPEKKRLTLCLSSQVGCRQGCRFCHTARMGLRRQLTTPELVGQLMIAQNWLRNHPSWQPHLPRHISNVVWMGMGEPLDNVDAVLPATEIMGDPWALGLAPRRITVSTAGHLDGLRRFADSQVPAALALSLHSPYADERSRLMPINRRYPLTEVLDFLDTLIAERRRPCLIQYTLIAGVNDSDAHADGLRELLHGRLIKINLIPFNPIAATSWNAPSPERVQAFRDILHAGSLRTMVRYSKGQDIAAACGQLIQVKGSTHQKTASGPQNHSVLR